VDRFAGHDPQPLARLEAGVLQQARAPLGAGVSDLRPVGQFDVARKIPDLNFQTSVYNTVRQCRGRTRPA